MCVWPSSSSMQNACAVLYSYFRPVWLYNIFPLSLTRHDFVGKNLLNKKLVFWFSLQIFLKNCHSKNKSVRRCHQGRVSYEILMTLENFLNGFLQNTEMSNFMNILPVGANVFNACGRKWYGKRSLFEILRKRLTLSDPMSDLLRNYDFPVPDAFLNLYPFQIQFFCHPHTPQLLFILDEKEVGGLLVIILQF
jgi:hypothetical protein